MLPTAFPITIKPKPLQASPAGAVKRLERCQTALISPHLDLPVAFLRAAAGGAARHRDMFCDTILEVSHGRRDKTDKGTETENTCGTMFLLKWSVGSNFALHSFELRLPWRDRELMSEKKKRCLPTPEGGDGRRISEKKKNLSQKKKYFIEHSQSLTITRVYISVIQKQSFLSPPITQRGSVRCQLRPDPTVADPMVTGCRDIGV